MLEAFLFRSSLEHNIALLQKYQFHFLPQHLQTRFKLELSPCSRLKTMNICIYICIYIVQGFFFFLSVSLHFHKKIKRKRNRQLTTAYSTVSNTSGKTHLHVKRLGPKKKKCRKQQEQCKNTHLQTTKLDFFFVNVNQEKKLDKLFNSIRFIMLSNHY